LVVFWEAWCPGVGSRDFPASAKFHYTDTDKVRRLVGDPDHRPGSRLSGQVYDHTKSANLPETRVDPTD